MKDAKEWFKEMTRLDKEPPSWHDWVKMIQADARRSALTEAIEVCKNTPCSVTALTNLAITTHETSCLDK